MPFYGKWYRFWLFWMLTDGIYEAVKADPTWNGGPGAVSPANALMREMISAAIARPGAATRPTCWRRSSPPIRSAASASCVTTASGSRR